MNEKVVRTQIAVYDTPTVGVGYRLDSLAKPFFSKVERYVIVTFVDEALEAAIASLRKQEARLEICLPS